MDMMMIIEMMTEFSNDHKGEGWLKTWGFHHYFHGVLNRKVIDDFIYRDSF